MGKQDTKTGTYSRSIERISNGFIASDGTAEKLYLPDEEAVLKYIMGPIRHALDEMKHHVWDGKFTVAVDHDIL